MYKLLLCIRYLQTRYLAFICIVSVMLGVATLIVVNAVMSGFSTKLKDRLHGVLSDVVVDTDRTDGFEVVRQAPPRPLTLDEIKTYRAQALRENPRLAFTLPPNPPDNALDVPEPVLVRRYQTPNALVVETAYGKTLTTKYFLTPDGIIDEIMRGPAGEHIAAITPTIETFAILQFKHNGAVISKPIKLIGIDPEGLARVGGFADYLYFQKGPHPSFDITPEAMKRYKDNVAKYERENRDAPPPPKLKPPVPDPNAIPEPDEGVMLMKDLPPPKLYGVIPGYTLAHFRYRDDAGNVVEEPALRPGDDVIITTAGGQELKPVWGSFVVVDYLKTEMSEYDQSYVYVPLDQLQRIRGMVGRATSFQIKLKNYEKDKAIVTRELQKHFPAREGSRVATWEEHQGPLLAAIDVERGILNLLLFMIVGVAGFSVLAIFTMIVSEKYRDIGIMKSLGASNWGVMHIFLGYGLLLGTVGSALGTALGLWITAKINEIEAFLTAQTGRAVFPRDIYYFKEIPTNVDPLTVVLINVGAVAIAVAFSLLPAWRASRLHPVRALRFE